MVSYPALIKSVSMHRTSIDRMVSIHNRFFSGNEIIPIDFININIVGGCNFRCKTCYTWKDSFSKLSFESCERFFRAIQRFVRKRGVHMIYAGGEPLMHDRIYDLVKLSAKYGYRTSIITNGWFLTERVLRNLLEAGLKTIMISLDSAEEDVHDMLRGVKGSFKKIMEALSLMPKYRGLYKDFTFGINTTVSAANISGMPNLVHFVKGKNINHIQFQVVTQVFNTEHIDSWY